MDKVHAAHVAKSLRDTAQENEMTQQRLTNTVVVAKVAFNRT